MKNPIFVGMKLPEVNHVEPLERRLPTLSHHSISIVKVNTSRFAEGLNHENPSQASDWSARHLLTYKWSLVLLVLAPVDPSLPGVPTTRCIGQAHMLPAPVPHLLQS